MSEENLKLSTCKWFAVCQLATNNKAKEVAVIQHDKKVKWIERDCQSNDWGNLAAIDFSSVGRREWRFSDRALVKLILGRLWHIFSGLVWKSIYFCPCLCGSYYQGFQSIQFLIGLMKISWLIKLITVNPMNIFSQKSPQMKIIHAQTIC